MKMSRQWMYEDRRSGEFVNGFHSFMRLAEANKRDGFIFCPCGVCKNTKSYSNSKDIHLHLFKHGFMSGYNCWTKHGERGVMMEENEKMRMMTGILGSCLNTMVQWGDRMKNKRMKNKRMKNKKVKKMHHMSPMMSFAVSLLMHREDAKVKGRS